MAWRDVWPFNLSAVTSTRTVNTKPVPGVAAQEHGVSGTENFGGYIRKEDYNPDLDDWQKAVAIYDKMRRTDSMVRAMLQVIKLPLRGAHWQCNPATNDPIDQKIADFCSNAIFDDDAMEDSWDFVLRHILLMLDFGVSVLEKVWMVDTEGNYRFKRLAPRLPRTLREWHVNREGKLIALVQYAPVTHFTSRDEMGHQRVPRYGSSVSYQYLTIPAEYCAVFCLEREGDNYEGFSLLRNIYRNWWFKDQAYHVMGVGLDRWGVGIPIAQLEEGHGLTQGDQDQLREILQKVRANERAYMVMPEHVKFSIEPSGGGQGTQSHFGISWLDHNDAQIARNVLAGFLTMGRDPKGTLGFGSRLTDMFISSLNGIAKGIAGDIKKQLVKPLCDFNFDMSNREYPEPVCLDLEQVDLDALIEVLAKLSGTMITPQDDDEETLRKILGLPPMKGSTKGKRDGAGGAGGAKAGGPGGPGGPPPPGGAGGPQGGPQTAVEAAGAAGLPGGGQAMPVMMQPVGVVPPGPDQGGQPKPVQLAATWEEGQHPRDNSGKFDEGSGAPDPTRTKEAAKASNTKLDAKDEGEFKQWYATAASKLDLSPDPEGQFYDYRGAFKAGVEVPDKPEADWHWPSDHKQKGHPAEIVGGFSTITGKRVKGTKRAKSVEELVEQGWEREAAEELMKQDEEGEVKKLSASAAFTALSEQVTQLSADVSRMTAPAAPPVIHVTVNTPDVTVEAPVTVAQPSITIEVPAAKTEGTKRMIYDTDQKSPTFGRLKAVVPDEDV